MNDRDTQVMDMLIDYAMKGMLILSKCTDDRTGEEITVACAIVNEGDERITLAPLVVILTPEACKHLQREDIVEKKPGFMLSEGKDWKFQQ